MYDSETDGEMYIVLLGDLGEAGGDLMPVDRDELVLGRD